MKVLSIAPRLASMVRQASTATAVPNTQGTIAKIPIHGVMMSERSPIDLLLGIMRPTTDDLAAAIIAAGDAENIDEVLLDVATPGGSPSGGYKISTAVEQVAKIKPVRAVVNGMALSAGYLAITHATEIIAGPMDVIGSIGAIIAVEEQAEGDNGGKVHIVRAGKHKAAGIDGLTEEQKEHLETVAEGLRVEFKSRIESGRGMTAEAAEELADGREFLGRDALALGLITKLKGENDMSDPKEAAPAAGAEQGMWAKVFSAFSTQEKKLDAIDASNKAQMEALSKKLEASEAKSAQLEAETRITTLMAGCSPVVNTDETRAILAAAAGQMVGDKHLDETIMASLNATAPKPTGINKEIAGDDGFESIKSELSESQIKMLRGMGHSAEDIKKTQAKLQLKAEAN